MTKEEAIKYIKESDKIVWDETSEEAKTAVSLSIEALEKAEKYRWHDLWKNPDDLPEVNPNNDNEKDVLLLVLNKNRPEKGASWHIGHLKSAKPYSTCDKSCKTNFWGMPSYDCDWCIWGWSYFFEPDVLAWKEIEPFEEEEADE